jgi:hypothetical protein
MDAMGSHVQAEVEPNAASRKLAKGGDDQANSLAKRRFSRAFQPSR